MESAVKYNGVALYLWLALCLSLPCYAQDPATEKIGDFGTIDWIGQRIVAKGVGAIPAKYSGTPQARPLALRAAVTDARRNLLEVVKGVHIDSTTRVENYMIKDETIVSRVKGVLNNAPVEEYRYLSDGTVEATVSMPLTGQMGEILSRMSTPSQIKSSEALPSKELAMRVYLLENRVKALEDKLDRFGRITYEQEQVIQLFKEVMEVWTDDAFEKPYIIHAGLGTEGKLAYLKKKLDEQDIRLRALSRRLDELSRRLTSVQPPADRVLPQRIERKPRPMVMYTGLVIDARKTNFRPCLRPEIYSQGKLVYPGGYINMQKAVRGGIVRYYRNIGRAQQSDRIGTLPYTIEAMGTWKGDRSLEIHANDYESLRSFIEMPKSFMSDCKVVVVF